MSRKDTALALDKFAIEKAFGEALTRAMDNLHDENSVANVNFGITGEAQSPRVGLKGGGMLSIGDKEPRNNARVLIRGGKAFAKFWLEGYEADKATAPDCVSEDGIVGSQFGECAKCQYRKNGDCLPRRNLLAIVEYDGEILPDIHEIDVPATSLKNLKQLGTDATRLGIDIRNAVVKVGVAPHPRSPHGQMTFEIVGLIQSAKQAALNV